CEKPPGRNPDDIKKVISVEKRNKNIKLKYGFNHRYHESIKLAKKIISQKMYGDVVNIRAIYGKSKIITFKKCDWRAKRKFAGGGILLDQGIHLLDLLYYFVGKFEKYKSFISNRYWKYDVEDNAFGLMKNGKGVIASIHSTATQWQHKFSMEISLNHATLLLNGILSGSKSYGKETITIISKKNKIKKKIFYSKDNSWKQEIDEFAEIILKNLKVKTGNSEQALDVMNMVYKIYKDDKSWRYN
ncbi:Gfo/Idh/MocA family oxidoreductase, partial [Candidatus Pelagibacter sp.]|nr:Gfo/Idh/MocA family oxidoreductase [Candidatus Pelagibacter sp.]